MVGLRGVRHILGRRGRHVTYNTATAGRLLILLSRRQRAPPILMARITAIPVMLVFRFLVRQRMGIMARDATDGPTARLKATTCVHLLYMAHRQRVAGITGRNKNGPDITNPIPGPEIAMPPSVSQNLGFPREVTLIANGIATIWCEFPDSNDWIRTVGSAGAICR